MKRGEGEKERKGNEEGCYMKEVQEEDMKTPFIVDKCYHCM